MSRLRQISMMAAAAAAALSVVWPRPAFAPEPRYPWPPPRIEPRIPDIDRRPEIPNLEIPNVEPRLEIPEVEPRIELPEPRLEPSQPRPGTGGGPATITFRVRNSYRYRMQVAFYSQDRNLVWGAFDLDDRATHDLTLNCRSGEKICYGAWPTGTSSPYWGVGPNNSHGCTRCCWTCGGGSPELEFE